VTVRVLITSDAVGGVWRYALDLAKGLCAADIGVVLAAVGPDPGPAQAAEADAVDGLELIRTGLPLDWTADGPAAVREAGGALAELARDRRVDLVHLNSAAYAASIRFPVPVVGVAHSCVATWWRAVKGGTALPEDFRWRTELTGEGYRACQTVLAPSRAFAAATAEAYGLPAPQLVHNGRAPTIPAAAEPGPVFVFTAGRLWDEGKNVAALDAAAARLRLPVAAAGPLCGPNGETLAFPNLQPLGTLDEAGMAQRLARRPIFVSAALYEPFGLAVLEAAAAGCALVLSDIPTFRELWTGAAVFVRPHDHQALAEAVEALAESELLRERYGAAAAAHARRYSLPATVAGVLAAYRRAAAGAFAGREAAA